MDLSNLTPPEGALKTRKRKGRGVGSGNGKTAGRGHKGQLSRAGGRVPATFEGGQMPLHRRIPKRGFTNNFATEWSIVNLSDLEDKFDDGDVVDAQSLAERGLIWSRWQSVDVDGDVLKIRITRPLKVLGNGTLSKALTVRADRFSASARAAINAAGGQAQGFNDEVVLVVEE